MAYGLQIFNSLGQVELDFSTRHAIFIGTYGFTLPGGDHWQGLPTYGYVDVSVPNILPDGNWFCYPLAGKVYLEVFTGVVRVWAAAKNVSSVQYPNTFTYDYGQIPYFSVFRY